MERWLPIVGYEGYYEVSSKGRVRSIDRIATDGSRRRGQLRKLVPLGGKDGPVYLTVMLSCGSKVKCVRVHTEVLRAFRGQEPAGHEGRHLDGDSLNNWLGNLAWGTPRQNTEDKRRHERIPAGSQHWNARLTEQDIEVIRLSVIGGLTQKRVAELFGVRQQHISKIMRELRWAK